MSPGKVEIGQGIVTALAQIAADELTPLAGVNIIPVIDVSLVLLIILLATSPIFVSGVGAMATFNSALVIYLLPMSLLGTGEAAASLPAAAGASIDN